jgi:transcriptional regulator with XRE-family HTH domain
MENNYHRVIMWHSLHKSMGEAGLSEEALAEIVGVDRSSVNNWISGTSAPRLTRIRHIAQALSPEHAEQKIAQLLVDMPTPESVKNRQRPEKTYAWESLDKAMREKGISVKELAKMLDMNPHTVYLWKIGEINPPYRRMHQIAEALKPEGESPDAFRLSLLADMPIPTRQERIKKKKEGDSIPTFF